MNKIFAIIVLIFFSLNISAFAQEPTPIVEEVDYEFELIQFPEIIDLSEDEIIEEIITPDSDIYSIKKLFEEIQGYFYSLDSQKLEYFLNLAEKRLDEIEALGSEEEKFEYMESLIADFLSSIVASEEVADKIFEQDQQKEIEGKDDTKQDEEALDNNDHLVEIDEAIEVEETEGIEQLKDDNNLTRDKVLRKVEKFNTQHERLIAKFERKLETAPVPARKGLENAVGNIQKGHERRVESLLSKAGITIDVVEMEEEQETKEIQEIKEPVKELEIDDIRTQGSEEETKEISNETKNRGNGNNGNGNNGNGNNGNGAKKSSSNSRHNR